VFRKLLLAFLLVCKTLAAHASYEPLARVDTFTLKTAQNDAHFSIAAQATNTSAGEEISPENDAKNKVQPNAKIFYFHNDLNGLPQELSQDGQFVWRASYKVWGNVVSEEWTGSYAKTNAKAQPETQNLRFQGQYYDVETGLHYNTFRFYDPDIGRFTSPDPIGLEGGDNLYAYAPNPVTWVDPWGLNASPETAAQFEARISKMPPSERVGAVRGKVGKVALKNGWEHEPKISRENGRDVYRTSNGELRAADTQHGRIEHTDSRGKHLGEFDIEGKQTKPADTKGRHNLKC
jgi:RHS repeat-associated protein